MSEPLLATEGLFKEYQVGKTRVTALRGVDFALEHGEIVALVGESGSGKTTLGNLILGIERPTAGVIRFDGAEVPPKRLSAFRRRVQVVPQNPISAINPKRTIFQTVALPLAVHRLVPRRRRRERVAELLDLVGLAPDIMDRQPSILSGGQRQRVALARAIAAEPAALVLDEPTSALDVSVQARVLKLLVDLKRQLSLSYLFITHDLSVVRMLADRIVVLFRGEVVEVGPTAVVFAAPKHRYTQMLLSSVPVVSEEEELLKPDWAWDREVINDNEAARGCRFRPRCPYAIAPCESEQSLVEIAPANYARCCNPGTQDLAAAVTV